MGKLFMLKENYQHKEGNMGKAASRRNYRRQEFLSRLAQEDPQRFNSEWDFRLGSWLEEIRAGFRHGFIDARPVFNILDKALNLLRSCGDTAMKMQFKRTFDILSTECVSVTAGHCGRELYRLNQKYGFLDYDPRNINPREGGRNNGRRLNSSSTR